MNENNYNVNEFNSTVASTNVNNALINSINNVAQKYGLTQEEINQLYQMFQNNQHQDSILQAELDNMGDYFYQQHKLTNMCNTTKPLEPGKNYYVTTQLRDNKPKDNFQRFRTIVSAVEPDFIITPIIV